MERDNLMAIINNLRNSFDDAENRDELLNQISNEVSALYDTNDTLSSSNSEYVTANEQLRAANMKLFLQIGSEPLKKQEEPPAEPPEKKPLKFEDLFNEKGELK